MGTFPFDLPTMNSEQADKAKEATPSTTEQSGRQAMVFQPTNAAMMTGIIGTVDGNWSWGYPGSGPSQTTRGPAPGIFSQFTMNGLPIAWPGAYAYFRRILADPSVRFVRALAMAPILATKWRVKVTKDAPAEAQDTLQTMFDDLRLQFWDDAVRAVDYGWVGFEQCFDVVKEGKHEGKFWLRKIKALIHDLTAIYVTREGDLIGFNNNGDQIDPAKCLLYSYDAESGNLYGRGRCQNLLEVIPWWRDANDGAAQYDRKIAGVFLVCHYPPGQSVDRDGKVVENWKIAQDMLNAISSGHPIAVCNEFAGEVDTFLQGASVADRTRWKLELLEDKGSRQPGFNERLSYLDRQKARAYLVPERAAFEAQKSGSKADSESHGDIILTQADFITQRLCAVLSGTTMEVNSPINNILRVNWGQSAVGTACLEPVPIDDDKKNFVRDVTKQLLSDTPMLAAKGSSVQQIFHEAGMPLPSEGIKDGELVQLMENAIAIKVPQNNPAKLSRIRDYVNGSH